MSDKPILVLSPADSMHTPDSILITADCGHRAWISKGGQESMAEQEMTTICLLCIEPAMDSLEWQTTPQIREELDRLYGDGTGDLMTAQVRDPEHRKQKIELSKSQQGNTTPRWK